MVKGENFLVRIDDREDKWGFFTTRFVTAKDTVEGESKVLQSIRLELEDWVLNDRSDPPMLHVTECEEVAWWRNRKRGKGFSWFPEKPQQG
jgi:hypothetical protein